MRLIGADGSQLGVMTFTRALELAKQGGLDLALVADNATPPVCRIVNFGKLIYEQKKKEKEQRKLQHAHKAKEIKFSCNIDPHDYSIKINHAIEFLQKSYNLKASMMFKGREMAHKELGFGIMQKVVKDLEGHGIAEAPPKLMGRSIIINFNPAHH
ncbi:MAG: translation initiation factor IF-3 [Victivallales bacterium]